MVTRVNPVAGRYFNDPAFAAGASNLAAAFAPPSAEDYLAAEKYKGLKTQNSALNDLYGQADGDTDLLGVIADLYDPTSGWGAMRGKLENDRYATDRGFEASIQNNALDNETTRRGLAFGALTNPDGRQSVSDDEVMRALGVDAGGFTAAQPVAPSETQVRGGLIAGADLTSDDIYALAMGSTPTEKVVDPNTGRPKLTYGALGARAGEEPFVPKGSEAAPTAITYDRGDGVRLGGFIEGGQYRDSAGQPLTPEQAGSAAEVGKPMGTLRDVGGVTNSNLTDAVRLEASAFETKQLVTDLTDLINSRAGAAGVVGGLQSLTQDLAQTAKEFGAAMEEADLSTPVTEQTLERIEQLGEGQYDPVFQQIRAGLLRLAYVNARLSNGGNEVSQAALLRELDAQSRWNDESIKAALSMSLRGADAALEKAKALRGEQPQLLPSITGAPDEVPEGVTPEEWGVMTPEERAAFQ